MAPARSYRRLRSSAEQATGTGFAVAAAVAASLAPLCLVVVLVMGSCGGPLVAEGTPKTLLFDTDMNSDDVFALIYLLKQNRSEIDLRAITISANAFANAGHAVNHVYDILYMMNRKDIQVGVGGDGGILENGTIQQDVGGYLPLVDQGPSTAGDYRYRQAIPTGQGGLLDSDTYFGLRRRLLPQGNRHYSPLMQSTTQEVMINTISSGPTTVLTTGSLTNLANFLLSNPHMKRNIEHIYVMGGSIRHGGNLYTCMSTNPFAEFNVYLDPFAAYQVIKSGIPLTLIPLDATNTIPISENFFMAFQAEQNTYESKYCFEGLKFARATWFDDKFYTSYFMWDSFASGVAVSSMRSAYDTQDANEFAEMEYINITIVTSNEPYGIYDGSNPFFDGRAIPKFNLQNNGVHSGHLQISLDDPRCHFYGSSKASCKDGYTRESNDSESVRIRVATKAKPTKESGSLLDKEFYRNFLDALNNPSNSARFPLTMKTPFHEDFYKSNTTKAQTGKPVVLDMDMSPGDFLSLIYILKVPTDIIDLKAILVSGNGWANAATIDVIYDVLHMMGRDDIPVGLGKLSALGTPLSSSKSAKAIPHGSGGYIDTDSLFGLARSLPRSPRSYTAENSVKHGAPRDTDHPELRQPLAPEVWESISRAVYPSNRITVLTNGPLTNLANIILEDKLASTLIQDIYIVGGNIVKGHKNKGNIFTVPSNKYAEFNMFLDPVAARSVMESGLNITIIPLNVQKKVSSFTRILEKLQSTEKTPESALANRLLSRLQKLHREHKVYHHLDKFLGEILGAVYMANYPRLNSTVKEKHATVLAGDITKDGEISIGKEIANTVKILTDLDAEAYYSHFTNLLGAKEQSAVIGCDEHKRRLKQQGLISQAIPADK